MLKVQEDFSAVLILGNPTAATKNVVPGAARDVG